MEKRSNKKPLSLDLERTLKVDNYFFISTNKTFYRLSEEKYKSDSIKYLSKHEIAIKLNKTNKSVATLFENIRAELLSTLNGYTNLEIGDTLNLKDVNYKDEKITKKYFTENFKSQLEEINQIQTDLNNLTPNAKSCIYEPIEREWREKEYNAEEFIVHMTTTENLLLKQINCIFEKLNTD